MLQQIFLPESIYELDYSTTMKTLSDCYVSDTPITGKVLRLNSSQKSFDVELGRNIIASMSFEEATIYELFNDNGGISPNLYQLVGKNIRAKIIGFDFLRSPILSRKANMLEALDFFKNETDQIITASITAFSRLSAFFDLGAGIIGRSFAKDFSAIKYSNIKDLGLKVGDVIPVKITSFIEEKNKFNLSRVATLPSVFNVIDEGDVYIAKVFGPVFDAENVGHFALVEDTFIGIVDSPEIELNYGDLVSVFVKKIKKDGKLKLSIVKKL